MSTLEQLKKRAERLARPEDRDKFLVCIPDNGRGSQGVGRWGNIIIYDETHPLESFMGPEERDLIRVHLDAEDKDL